MMDKKGGIMAAIKNRKGLAPKKGVNLMGIVEKLTAKRKAKMSGVGGCGKK